MDALRSFRAVWLADFEFCAPPGERPTPLCLVAREIRSGRLLRLWANELPSVPPWETTPDALFVAFYASAELGCCLSLNWALPTRILDLFAEFRCLTNGRSVPCGNGLLGALAFYGLDAMDATEKESMRALAMRGGPYDDAERLALLDYCGADVSALAKLLPAMLPTLDVPRALLRGRYMASAARMEHAGTPIDVEALQTIRDNWSKIKARLIAAVDADYGCYVPTGRTLNPQTSTGAAILDEAERHGVDPHDLADALDYLWRAEREAVEPIDAARREARRLSGLTVNRISRVENAYQDHTSIPRLDTTAREIAGRLPTLGIGPGYRTEDGVDDHDYAGDLWALLREPERKPRRDDPDLLRQAAEMVARDGGDPYRSRSFSTDRFAAWLIRNGIPWPRLDSGTLDLSDETFRQMARRYPVVAPLRELRHTLSQLRLNELAVGSDGRNRCLLSAFRATTGRNQPSNSRFIFGPSCWLRGLIRPRPGRAVAYLDWSAQEIGIAAALSGDRAMMDAYASGDPYLWLAKAGGFAPADATKATHGKLRDTFKIVYLASNYCMGERSLSQLLGQSEAHARELLRSHRERFPRFWRWSDAALDHAMLRGRLWTVFGWQVSVGPLTKPTSLRNFPVQANGAEMLRLACCLTTEAGIAVCAPVHDALLIEAAETDIDDAVHRTQDAMREAAETVLSGFPLRTDAKIVRHPERYSDPRGVRMWETVQTILAELPEGVEAEAFVF